MERRQRRVVQSNIVDGWTVAGRERLSVDYGGGWRILRTDGTIHVVPAEIHRASIRTPPRMQATRVPVQFAPTKTTDINLSYVRRPDLGTFEVSNFAYRRLRTRPLWNPSDAFQTFVLPSVSTVVDDSKVYGRL